MIRANSNRGSIVSNHSRSRDQSVFVPPQPAYIEHSIDKDVVFIKPNTSQTRNGDPLMLGSSRRNNSRTMQDVRKKCPWWLFFVIGALALSVTAGGIYYYFRHRAQAAKSQNKAVGVTLEPPIQKCAGEFFLHNGKCITCPQGTKWDGMECKVKQKQRNTRTEAAPKADPRSQQEKAAWTSNGEFRPADLRQFIYRIRNGNFYPRKPRMQHLHHYYNDDYPAMY